MSRLNDKPPGHGWTVGELRQALAGVPDDIPLLVYAPVAPGSDITQDYSVVTAGFGMQDDGDDRGSRPSQEFQIGVTFPDYAFYRQ